MLFLLRCTERGKEPHAGKNKLRNDIADCLRAAVPEVQISFNVGRIYVESERDIRAELASLHGVSSFSPCTVCDVNELDAHVLSLARRELAETRSFCVKLRRIGNHPFSSNARAGELGAQILAAVPGARVDLRDPDVMISIEIRDSTCFVFTEVVPGLDARGAATRAVAGPPSEDVAGGAPRFLVDAMLGTLASRLRALGFDTVWRRDTADSLILREAKAEGRTVLTQDRELSEIGGPSAYLVRGKTVELQLAEVIEHFALTPAEDQLFSRCSLCNTPLVAVEKASVAERVPARAFAAYEAFWLCSSCDKVYWKGSHYDEMLGALYGKKRPA